jgi:hypothetical protein
MLKFNSRTLHLSVDFLDDFPNSERSFEGLWCTRCVLPSKNWVVLLHSVLLLAVLFLLIPRFLRRSGRLRSAECRCRMRGHLMLTHRSLRSSLGGRRCADLDATPWVRSMRAESRGSMPEQHLEHNELVFVRVDKPNLT